MPYTREKEVLCFPQFKNIKFDQAMQAVVLNG